MKAIQIKQTGGSEVLEYVDMEMPIAGPGQAVIRTESIAVNYADIQIRKGLYPVMPEFPHVPGIEACGIVEMVGDGVTQVQVGQKVLSIANEACYAEYVLVDAATLVPIPETLDSDLAAALLANYLTAYHMIHTMAKLEKGQWILSYAALGGVGIAINQLANLAGFEVIGLTSSDEKVQQAKTMGINHVINYSKEDVVEQVMEITRDRGVDLILDSVAGPAFSSNFNMLAPLGQVIWYGTAAGLPPENLLEPLNDHFVKSVGIRTFHLTYGIAQSYPEIFAKSIQTLIQQLVDGKLEPVIYERLPLSEAYRAHDLLESRKTIGKLILKP